MQVMLFGAPPEFEDILKELKTLEVEINATAQKDEWEAHDSTSGRRLLKQAESDDVGQGKQTSPRPSFRRSDLNCIGMLMQAVSGDGAP